MLTIETYFELTYIKIQLMFSTPPVTASKVNATRYRNEPAILREASFEALGFLLQAQFQMLFTLAHCEPANIII